MEKQIVIQTSRHNHVLESKGDVKINDLNQNGTILEMEISSDNVVKHGEHGSFSLKKGKTMKYLQQEFNPVLKMMVQAFD